MEGKKSELFVHVIDSKNKIIKPTVINSKENGDSDRETLHYDERHEGDRWTGKYPFDMTRQYKSSEQKNNI